MQILQKSYLKLADHKNGKRIWLQGLRLEEAGYQIGSFYSLQYDNEKNRVVLSLSDQNNDARKVCRKKIGDRFYPLIDLVNQKMAEVFDAVDRVQVIVREGVIVIEYHHLDRARVEREERLKKTIREGRSISIGSMASGAGIMDAYIHRGLDDSGLRSGMIWAVEPENIYLQTSLNNNPIWAYDSQVIEGRIEDIDAAKLEAPLITVSGLPCSGSSLSGRSKNKLKFAEAHETAGTAFIGWLMAIKTHSPVVAILENVPQYSETISMHMIRETLSNWRYKVHEIVIGSEMGAFENRRRMCAVCVSEGIDFKFDLKPVREREKTLGEILDDVPLDADCWNPCEYLHKKEVRDLAAGKGFAMNLVDKDSTQVSVIGRGYHKWRSTESLVKHPTDSRLKRQLTVNELAKVKTIDKKLVAGMSRTRQVEMMGQSVLGVAFQSVGRNIGECLVKQYLSDVVAA
jgi:DNA (cytosine-5)-methyltransferase 1